jgi:hypothetical protein
MKKQVSKRLEATRRKNSRIWKKYRSTKKTLLSSKRIPKDIARGLVEEARAVAKNNIKINYEDYRGFKFGIVHNSPYKDFSYVKRHETINTQQKFFKASKYYNHDKLDSQIGDILNESNVLGVGLIFKVRDEETELIMFGSDYITKGLFLKLQGKGISLYDHVSQKLKYSKSVHEYELLNIQIRVIYAKTKNHTNKNKS